MSVVKMAITLGIVPKHQKVFDIRNEEEGRKEVEVRLGRIEARIQMWRKKKEAMIYRSSQRTTVKEKAVPFLPTRQTIV